MKTTQQILEEIDCMLENPLPRHCKTIAGQSAEVLSDAGRIGALLSLKDYILSEADKKCEHNWKMTNTFYCNLCGEFDI